MLDTEYNEAEIRELFMEDGRAQERENTERERQRADKESQRADKERQRADKAEAEAENAKKRIKELEAILDKAIQKMDALEAHMEEYEKFQSEIRKLEAYYGSQQWKDDFALEEAGELPDDLNCGVLSEDGIYNVLERNRELLERIRCNDSN
jgi:chromosome segregation ATPase